MARLQHLHKRKFAHIQYYFCHEYYDHVLFQTFPGASRTGIHNEGLLQRVDAHSHVCRNWGKALMIISIYAYILKEIFL